MLHTFIFSVSILFVSLHALISHYIVYSFRILDILISLTFRPIFSLLSFIYNVCLGWLIPSSDISMAEAGVTAPPYDRSLCLIYICIRSLILYALFISSYRVFVTLDGHIMIV